MSDALRTRIDRLQRQTAIGGLVLLAACAAGAIASPAQFFRSYLLGFLFWVSIALGSLAILMLHHLTGGAWGMLIRRLLESGARTLPLMALCVLPILFGASSLYEWARPDAVAADELLKHKAAYLNVPFFVARTVAYFVVWVGLSWLFSRWSAAGAPEGRFEGLSGPGLVVFGLTATFASIDWVMSLEPRWLSTVYGVLFMVGAVLATLAFMIAVVAMLARYSPLNEHARPSHFHDLGNLMLAFVMLWGYISFSQYLIIWSANLPEEIPWYITRLKGGWQHVALALLLAHFAIPFAVLLSRRNKRSARALAAVAMVMILMRLVDLFWLIAPAFHPDRLAIHWMDVAAPLGLGGIWIAVFLRQLKSRPLVAA